MAYEIQFEDRTVRLPSTAMVMVETEKGVVAPMEAKGVRPGSSLIIETDYVRTTGDQRPLDTIKEALGEIPIYQLVRGTVYETDEDGNESTALRAALFRGLGPEIGIGGVDTLEERIFRVDGLDFLSEEYGAVASRASEILRDAVEHEELEEGSCVKFGTIKDGWLAGKTFFPRNWELLGALRHSCPDLEPYYDSYTRFDDLKETLRATTDYEAALGFDAGDPNFYASYIFFVGVRQYEARKVSRPRGNGGRPEEKTQAGTFSFASITEFIRTYMKQEVTEDLSLGRVLSVRKVPDRERKGNGRRKATPDFARGILTGHRPPEDLPLETRTVRDTHVDYKIADHSIRSWLTRYVAHLTHQSPLRAELSLVGSQVSDYLYSRANPIDPRVKEMTAARARRFSEKDRANFRAFRAEVLADIKEGGPDEYLVVGRGNYSRLIRRMDELARLTPHEFTHFEELCRELAKLERNPNRKRKREIEREIQKSRRRMRSRFGFEPKEVALVETVYNNLVGRAANLKGSRIFTIGDLAQIDHAATMVLPMLTEVHNIHYLRLSEIKARLKAMNLEEILPRLFSEDIYFDADLL